MGRITDDPPLDRDSPAVMIGDILAVVTHQHHDDSFSALTQYGRLRKPTRAKLLEHLKWVFGVASVVIVDQWAE